MNVPREILYAANVLAGDDTVRAAFEALKEHFKAEIVSRDTLDAREKSYQAYKALDRLEKQIHNWSSVIKMENTPSRNF